MDKKGVDAGKRAKMIAADDITSGSKKTAKWKLMACLLLWEGFLALQMYVIWCSEAEFIILNGGNMLLMEDQP